MRYHGTKVMMKFLFFAMCPVLCFLLNKKINKNKFYKAHHTFEIHNDVVIYFTLFRPLKRITGIYIFRTFQNSYNLLVRMVLG